MKMANELQVFKKQSEFNILGLRESQAELYKYILACTKENKPIEFEIVADINYGFCGRKYWYTEFPNGVRKDIRCNGAEYLARLRRIAIEHNRPQNYYYYSTIQQWLKITIGSLVVRGLLNVIPKFDPESQK